MRNQVPPEKEHGIVLSQCENDILYKSKLLWQLVHYNDELLQLISALKRDFFLWNLLSLQLNLYQ